MVPWTAAQQATRWFHFMPLHILKLHGNVGRAFAERCQFRRILYLWPFTITFSKENLILEGRQTPRKFPRELWENKKKVEQKKKDRFRSTMLGAFRIRWGSLQGKSSYFDKIANSNQTHCVWRQDAHEYLAIWWTKVRGDGFFCRKFTLSQSRLRCGSCLEVPPGSKASSSLALASVKSKIEEKT